MKKQEVSVSEYEDMIRAECKAIGFKSPNFSVINDKYFVVDKSDLGIYYKVTEMMYPDKKLYRKPKQLKKFIEKFFLPIIKVDFEVESKRIKELEG